jgi:hypothetical protein
MTHVKLNVLLWIVLRGKDAASNGLLAVVPPSTVVVMAAQIATVDRAAPLNLQRRVQLLPMRKWHLKLYAARVSQSVLPCVATQRRIVLFAQWSIVRRLGALRPRVFLREQPMVMRSSRLRARMSPTKAGPRLRLVQPPR